MLETTLVSNRLSLRYPNPVDTEKTKTFTYSNISPSADDEALFELGDAFKSLMYNPAMETETLKSEVYDLYLPF